jgi:hypothetical protein
MRWRWQPPEEGPPAFEIAGGLVALAAALVARFVPAERFSLCGVCGFRRATGWPCPSCGATRAFLALAHGRWAEGIAHNPFFAGVFLSLLLFIPYAAWVVFLRKPRLRASFSGRRDAWFWGAVLALILLINWLYLLAHGE